MTDTTPRLVRIVNPRRPLMKSVRAWAQFKAVISEQGAPSWKRSGKGLPSRTA